MSVSTTGDDVIIAWTEQGGPPVVPPEGIGGYGSRLLQRTMSGQLGGAIDYNWSSTGAVVSLKINGARLSV
jgi:two-component sensor histidine kinase